MKSSKNNLIMKSLMIEREQDNINNKSKHLVLDKKVIPMMERDQDRVMDLIKMFKLRLTPYILNGWWATKKLILPSFHKIRGQNQKHSQIECLISNHSINNFKRRSLQVADLPTPHLPIKILPNHFIKCKTKITITHSLLLLVILNFIETSQLYRLL